MVDQWFYARDHDRLGPFSSQRLRELATEGEIRPTDTVWKAGIEKGVLASNVKHLFPAAQRGAEVVAAATAPPPEPAPPPPAPPPAPEPDAQSGYKAPPLDAPKTSNQSSSHQHDVKKGRATAGRGAVIVGQDGTTVQYRMKCISCQHVDASKKRMPIRRGTTRLGYYCPKCRKLQPVEIQGVV